MSKKKFFLVTLALCAVLLPSLALAQYGLEETAGAAGLAKYGTSIPGMIGNILGTALSLVGVLFFALMLFGGVMWMTSRGNAEQEKKALETITAAIIGILIVLGSYALTSFVFNNLVSGNSGVGNGDKNPPPENCENAKDATKGCDTCTATKGSAYACRDNSKDECYEGSIVDSLCQAKGQGENIKCCLKDMSISECGKLAGDLCVLPCKLVGSNCTLP